LRNGEHSTLFNNTFHSLHQLSSIAIGDGENGHPKGPLRAANVRVARVKEPTLQRHALVRVRLGLGLVRVRVRDN
jgi:hypothetical protein